MDPNLKKIMQQLWNMLVNIDVIKFDSIICGVGLLRVQLAKRQTEYLHHRFLIIGQKHVIILAQL